MSIMKGRMANIGKEMNRTGGQISKKETRETENWRYMAKGKF